APGLYIQSCANYESLLINKLSKEDGEGLCIPVTKDEIKRVISSIDSNSSPGPDGFNSHFYKHDWDLVGDDLVLVVQDFFTRGELPDRLILPLLPVFLKPKMLIEWLISFPFLIVMWCTNASQRLFLTVSVRFFLLLSTTPNLLSLKDTL
ncbi:Transposon TX1 uncharacterized 149 kDa protein, partial [Linum perenne]